jgi:predicted nucleic acid-binding protein
LTAYLDASVIVSALVLDDHISRLSAWLGGRPQVRFSAWTITEVSSALSHQMRLGRSTPEERFRAEIALDDWANQESAIVPVLMEDFLAARRLIQRHATLRAGDALHLAVAARENLDMATFDLRLAGAASAEGLSLVF